MIKINNKKVRLTEKQLEKIVLNAVNHSETKNSIKKLMKHLAKI